VPDAVAGPSMAEPLSENCFHDWCASAGIGVLAIDDRLVIRYCNAAAARLLDRLAADLIGAPVTSVVPPERRELAQRQIERALAHDESSEFELRHRLAGHPPVHLAVTLSPTAVADGAARGASIWIRDITRQVELLRNVAQAQKMAALESMAGAVAHHFNNLLGGMVTAISFADTSDHPDAPRRALRTTTEALSRLQTLTSGLLAFAEGDHAASAPANLSETVTRHAQSLSPTLTERGITLETDIQVVDLALPARSLATVLANLTTNAVEAMPEGGTLKIELQSAPSGGAVLTIGDTALDWPSCTGSSSATRARSRWSRRPATGRAWRSISHSARGGRAAPSR